ncbi:MAG: peptide deformylase [Flavobacteriales bacterium]|nr:peptide deformylase [Flavobacteriales bacterium]MBS4040048.1 peptide deformylase [Flavobacteriales bacterium]
MVLSIVAYGDPVLRKVASPISNDYPNFNNLVQNMFETMYQANGVGLAAPQVGLPIRLFVIDTTPFSDSDDLSEEEKKQLNGFKKVFVNAKIEKEEGEPWNFNEGCLSIPDVREDVSRKPLVTITYQDEDFQTKTETFDGLIARVIQHEYDHIEGILFTDHLSTFKKTMIKRKLNNILTGKIFTDYKIKFYKK